MNLPNAAAHNREQVAPLGSDRISDYYPAVNEAEITMEILKHGSHVEVLAPEWLQEKVIEEIGKVQNKYRG